ncbi:MAG: YceI family protein [Sandaracinaceae bacterium]
MRDVSIAISLVAAMVGCGQSYTEGVAEATVEEAPAEVPEAAEGQAAEGQAAEDEAAEDEAAEAEGAEGEAGEPEQLTVDVGRSSVGFTGAKVTQSHDGRFPQFEGTIDLRADELTASRVAVTIRMASLEIEPDRLANHLKTEDFFDVEAFPTATFESTRIAEGADGDATHTVTGNLTLHGQTHAITFPATIEVTDEEARARAEFQIDRNDWGIVYPGMPDDLIRDEVVIRFDVRAPRSS